MGVRGDAGARGSPADAARPTRADTTESLRVVRRLTCLGHPSVTGLENGASAVLAAATTLANAEVQTTVASPKS